MRLLLLLMTGLGFTLGLLCGLLLHLPADGLPATLPLPLHPHGDLTARAGRSISQQRALMTEGGLAQAQPHNATAEGHLKKPRGESEVRSLHAPSLAGRSANSVVSGEGQRQHTGQQDRGQRNSQGQEGLSRRAGQGKGEGVGVKEAPHPPPPRAAGTRPVVTSYRLKLRNAGGHFVVDSAVQRQVDEAGEEIPAQDGGGDGDAPEKTLPSKDNTGSSHSLNTTLGDMVQGVLWSPTLEDSCPRGTRQDEAERWRRKAAGMEVVRMEEGCGRMQNRMLTFKDGSQACARYRLNTDQMQGELYSYYLASLLHIHNLPPALLLPVHPLTPQWRSVHLQMSLAQWADNRPVILTRWMPDLLPAHIPQELREDDRQLHPTEAVLGKKTVPELCDLLQWSDLIVFDYLTANLDRLVNNMFNKQWNAEMMSNPAHNLEKTHAGSLVFLDNESGLFHGYRLLEKYQGYHEALLSSLCVFRASTARAVKTLHQSRSVGQELQQAVERGEEHHRHLPPMPERNVEVLQERLARVHEQIVRCEALYGR